MYDGEARRRDFCHVLPSIVYGVSSQGLFQLLSSPSQGKLSNLRARYGPGRAHPAARLINNFGSILSTNPTDPLVGLVKTAQLGLHAFLKYLMYLEMLTAILVLRLLRIDMLIGSSKRWAQ